jgi:AraC-like DNA-binding protein
MTEAYALHEGAFGRAIVLELRANLVAHAHSETQLAFWLGGARAQAHIGSQVVEYSEHTALGANAFESHDAVLLDNSGPSIFLAFLISKQWLEERGRARGRSFRFPSPRVPIDPALRQACWRVLDMIITAQQARTSVDDEVERLLAAAVDASVAPQPPQGARLPGPALDYRLRAAIAHMREHVAEKMTVDDIAARVGLSRASVFALFRDQLNTTPQVFLSAVRVEEAMRRVSDGEALTHVALDLGFSAPGNFSRFFKEHTGVSPSTYRRAAAETAAVPVTGVPR